MMDYHQKALDYDIPFPTAAGLDSYIQRGVHPGAFLEAVIRNDFRTSYQEADERNKEILHKIMAFMCEIAPMSCWGDSVALEYWTAKGGIDGMMADHRGRMMR